MTAQVEDFGERAATEDEANAWVTLVRQGQVASRGWRPRKPDDLDRMRPVFGSGHASSESGE